MNRDSAVTGIKTGFALAGAVAVGLAAIAVFSRSEWPKRTLLETVTQPSAVEDRTFFTPPKSLVTGQIVFVSGTVSWAAATAEPVKLRDGRMLSDGRADPPILYRAEGRADDGTRYLKVDVDRYLPVVPQLPPRAPSSPP